MNMPLISRFLIKTIITLVISQTLLSCASAQGQHLSNDSKGAKAMTADTSGCKTSSILKSKALIDTIFQDILKTYPHTGGGGVTSIKEVSTNTFEVYIAQEERIDVLLYELKIDEDCNVEQLKKSDSTISFGQ